MLKIFDSVWPPSAIPTEISDLVSRANGEFAKFSTIFFLSITSSCFLFLESLSALLRRIIIQAGPSFPKARPEVRESSLVTLYSSRKSLNFRLLSIALPSFFSVCFLRLFYASTSVGIVHEFLASRGLFRWTFNSHFITRSRFLLPGPPATSTRGSTCTHTRWNNRCNQLRENLAVRNDRSSLGILRVPNTLRELLGRPSLIIYSRTRKLLIVAIMDYGSASRTVHTLFLISLN